MSKDAGDEILTSNNDDTIFLDTVTVELYSVSKLQNTLQELLRIEKQAESED